MKWLWPLELKSAAANSMGRPLESVERILSVEIEVVSLVGWKVEEVVLFGVFH